MSTELIIILSCVGGVVLIGLLFMFGRWSIKHKKKKTLSGELAKKVEKLKKEQQNANETEKPKDEFSLTQDAPTAPQEHKWHKKATPIISDYVDDDSLQQVLQDKSEEAVVRTSFQDLMKKHNEKKQNIEPVQEPEETEDDFDEFRAKHSVYTSYAKDQALVDEIQGLSPELKAVVFGNLFRRISDD